MASLTRKPTCQYWIACFTDHTGRQRQRSTRMTNRKKAMEIAEALESAYRKQMTEAQARRMLADIYEEIHGERMLSATTEDYIRQWVARKKVEVESRTSERYASVTRDFMAFLGDKKQRDLAFLTQKDFAGYRDHVATKLSVTSANNQLKILRIFMQDALRDGLVLNNPAALVKTIRRKVKNERGDRRAFTMEELKKVLAVADGEWRGMILTGLYTGQRLGDLARLTWANVDLPQKEIAFNTGKTGRRMVLPMTSTLHEYFLTLPSPESPDAPIFPKACEISSRQKKVSTLSRQFGELLAKSGLVPERTHAAKDDGEGRAAKRTSNGLSFHCLRHTATSLLKNAGVSDVVARDIIGHDTEAISRVYTHIDTDTKRLALEKMPKLDEPPGKANPRRQSP